MYAVLWILNPKLLPHIEHMALYLGVVDSQPYQWQRKMQDFECLRSVSSKKKHRHASQLVLKVFRIWRTAWLLWWQTDNNIDRWTWSITSPMHMHMGSLYSKKFCHSPEKITCMTFPYINDLIYIILEGLKELPCYLNVFGRRDEGESKSLSELHQVPGRGRGGQR